MYFLHTKAAVKKNSHIKNNTGQNNVFRNERIKELSKGGNTELKCHCCPSGIKTYDAFVIYILLYYQYFANYYIIITLPIYAHIYLHIYIPL